MEKMWMILTAAAVAVIILLALFHVIKATNPLTVIADDVACEFLDQELCEDIKAIEAK